MQLPVIDRIIPLSTALVYIIGVPLYAAPAFIFFVFFAAKCRLSFKQSVIRAALWPLLFFEWSRHTIDAWIGHDDA